MNPRIVSLVLGVVVLGTAVWVAGQLGAGGERPATWTEVVPDVWRSAGSPAGYALVHDKQVLLIDAPVGPETLAAKNVRRVDGVLLTHHHRDTIAALPAYLKLKTRVRAPKLSSDHLDPGKVARYWRDALPLRNSRTAYLVVAEGLAGIDYDVTDKTEITFGDWQIRAVATPGHSPDHVSYLARKKGATKSVLFAGDALAAAGQLWSPYTTDWDHWTDAGLKPTAESLRKLAALRPDYVLPARGPVISTDGAVALERTAKAVDEVAFLKSYERYT